MKTLLDGNWIETGQWFDVHNKYNGKVVDRVPLCDERFVEKALDSACKGSKNMKQMPAYERAEILEKASAALLKSSEDLARTVSAEAGKPLKYSRKEAKRAYVTMKFASEEAARNFYNDPAYGPVKQIRLNSSKNGTIVLAKEFKAPTT